ncbi:MAG TPA: TonB family protein [Cyclobacteriaceae bacterium]|nr:TonB family protein [Cyclobacteriaceae bacterium]
MKIIKNMLLLTAGLLMVQACSTKSAESEKAVVKAEEPSKVTKMSSAEIDKKQKRDKLEQLTRERTEKWKLQRDELALKALTFKGEDGEVIYNKAEVDPSYIGGNEAMMAYLRDNIKFPKEAEENGIEGTVFVDFVVGKNGVVRMVEVTDATSEEASQAFRTEAYRVVASMPKWTAGRQHDKPVSVKFSIPITFQVI